MHIVFHMANRKLQPANKSTDLREIDIEALVELGRTGIEDYARRVKAADGRHAESSLEVLRKAWALAPREDKTAALASAQAAVDAAKAVRPLPAELHAQARVFGGSAEERADWRHDWE